MSFFFKKEMASEEPHPTEQLRIVLVGKVQAGKTSVMNTLLRSSEENEKLASDCQKYLITDTDKCQREEAKIGQQSVVVVDTPGLCNTEKTEAEVIEEIKQCLSLADPGPHAFLFVLDLERFTKEGQNMVEIIKNTFGENVLCYSMALFTHGDELKENRTTIREFIEDNDKLKNFVGSCKGEYHVIENTDQSPSQVTELLQQINSMVQKNGGKFYNTEMFQDPQKEAKIAEVRKRISLSVRGGALAGAGLGVAVSYFTGGVIGKIAVAAAGAGVGGVIGGVGIVAVEHIKAKKCVIQ